MPEIPDAAVTAAADAILAQPGLDAEDLRPWVRWMVTTTLEAAAPAMAEAVAQKITEHMEEHEPPSGTPLGDRLRRAWRRHFDIAARVAAFAFSTEEDVKRMAAEAIARGEAVVCLEPRELREDGEHA